MNRNELVELLGMSEEEANQKIKEIILSSKTTSDAVKKIKKDNEIKNKIAFAYILGLTLVQEDIIDV